VKTTAAAADAVVLSRRFELGALAALFVMTLRQYVRGWRFLVLSLLFLMPSVLAAVVSLTSRTPPPADALEFAFLLNLIPHTLGPLVALLYSAGIIQDEVEEQTLTYLLLRPLPRWAIYLTKLSATILLTSALTAVFTLVTSLVIVATAREPMPTMLDLSTKAATLAGMLTLAQVAYCGLFGLLGLLMRRSLVVGVGYIILFEGVLASVDTVARRMTIMYHFRVLAIRCLRPAAGPQWLIDLATAPATTTCVLTLLIAGLIFALAGAFVFTAKEFRMKTPEGN
jgi:ABC-2 type transport system permease protein